MVKWDILVDESVTTTNFLVGQHERFFAPRSICCRSQVSVNGAFIVKCIECDSYLDHWGSGDGRIIETQILEDDPETVVRLKDFIAKWCGIDLVDIEIDVSYD